MFEQRKIKCLEGDPPYRLKRWLSHLLPPRHPLATWLIFSKTWRKEEAPPGVYDVTMLAYFLMILRYCGNIGDMTKKWMILRYWPKKWRHYEIWKNENDNITIIGYLPGGYWIFNDFQIEVHLYYFWMDWTNKFAEKCIQSVRKFVQICC